MIDVGTEPAGVVRVAAFSSAMQAIVIPAVDDLRTAYPQIDVIVTELEPHVSAPALERGVVDLAISADYADGGLPPRPHLQRWPVSGDQIVLVDAATAGRAHPAPADLREMSKRLWAMKPPGSRLADLTVRLCRSAGFEPRVAGYFSSYGALLAYVEQGLAVALLPALAVDGRYDVQQRDLATPSMRQMELLARPSASSRMAVQKVIDALLARAPK